MLKVELGDIIRSYDFKPMIGRDDSFVEGKVLDVNNTENGYQAYKIEVTKDSWKNEEYSRVGEIILVPWKVSFSEYQGRVMNLSR